MMRLACAVLTLAVTLPAAASAAEKMYSYDPANPDARRLTGRGLTFIFTQRMTATRAREVMATAVSAHAWLKPVGDGVLGKGGRAAMLDPGAEPISGDLYEIDPERGQGKVFIRAWCPGATRLFLAIPRFGHARPLPVTVLGDDLKTKGQVRVCARMAFDWRGEWKLPARRAPDPMDDVLGGAGPDGSD